MVKEILFVQSAAKPLGRQRVGSETNTDYDLYTAHSISFNCIWYEDIVQRLGEPQ